MSGPDIPVAPGVPALKRSVPAPVDQQQPLSSDAPAVASQALTQWGIYTQGGVLLLKPDNILGFEYVADSRISDYPIEGGGFQTYNKVMLPYDARVLMSKGGSLSERSDFLAALDTYRVSTDLYYILTPERTYQNVNIERVSISRSLQGGANMVTAEVMVREIRETATVQYTKVRTPSAASAQNDGPVQTQPTNIDPGQIK